MIEGRGKFLNRKTKTANKDYDKFFIYVPSEVARDGTFPFVPSEPVIIKIDSKSKRLLIEKIESVRGWEISSESKPSRSRKK